MNDKTERLTKCFSAVFPDLSNREIAAATRETVEKWDSLATITLVILIEEEFGIPIEPDVFDRLVSFRLFLSYLAELPANQ